MSYQEMLWCVHYDKPLVIPRRFNRSYFYIRLRLRNEQRNSLRIEVLVNRGASDFVECEDKFVPRRTDSSGVLFLSIYIIITSLKGEFQNVS